MAAVTGEEILGIVLIIEGIVVRNVEPVGLAELSPFHGLCFFVECGKGFFGLRVEEFGCILVVHIGNLTDGDKLVNGIILHQENQQPGDAGKRVTCRLTALRDLDGRNSLPVREERICKGGSAEAENECQNHQKSDCLFHFSSPL